MVLSVAASAALALAALAPTPSHALEIKPGSLFARGHAPVPQVFQGFVPPGATQGAFEGTGYDSWVQTLAEAPETSQAGGHPDFTTSFRLQGASNHPDDMVKDVVIELPPGSVSNPMAVPPCEAADLHLTLRGKCPTESQVGIVGTETNVLTFLSPVSNLARQPGVPMVFAFKVFGVTVLLVPRLRSESDYGLAVEVRDAATDLALMGTTLTLWGVPYDPVHDSHRFDTDVGKLGASVPEEPLPFIAAPTNCESGPLLTALSLRTWGNPERWIGDEATAAEQTGCERVGFDPKVDVRTTTGTVDSPTGLDVDIDVPQENRCDPGPPVECGLATSHLKELTISLPQGMSVNTAGANGLTGCSSAEIGLTTPLGSRPIHFTASPPDCPESSKVGTVEVETPLLESTFSGALYMADPYDNPFESLLAIYVTVDDPGRGIAATLAGRVAADPRTGQLAATFQEMPQLPIEHIRLVLKQGPHAMLRTPDGCGDHVTRSELTPYAAPREPVALEQTAGVTKGPAGSCRRPEAFSFDAGTVRPIAGVHSAFVLSVGRDDGSQNLAALDLSLPPGLVAGLRETPICPEVLLEPRRPQSEGGEEGLRTGVPDCPPASRVGSDSIGIGTGPAPYFLEQGPIFLAGPYRGAPLSLVIAVPAKAGPFDLGTVVTRAAVFIDPQTAGASISVDPLPQMLQGVPISYRTLRMTLDRPGFVRNPTSCEPARITATAVSAEAGTEELSSRFQVADCAALRFRPKLSLRLSDGLARNGRPSLRVVYRGGGAHAGLRSVAFSLPAGQLLGIRQVRALCDRDLPADRCPPRSRLGIARIWTPLLAGPLEGPVYLRAPDDGRLPDLLADVRQGQIQMLLYGHAATSGGRLRVGFPSLPDVPVSKAIVALAGGRDSILVNSESLCAGPRRTVAVLRSHNGRRKKLRPAVDLRGRCRDLAERLGR